MGRPLAFVLCALSLCSVGACKKTSDAEVQKVIDDLGVLDDAVVDTVQYRPNDEGLAAAESIVAANKRSTRDRLSALDVTEISPEASMAVSNACVKNYGASQLVIDYVRNAVLKTNPALVARAQRLAVDLCNVCPTNGTSCDVLGPPAP
jgi:hypothetical protein